MSKVFGEPFALIPEWLLYSDVSDRAVRLWCVLHRHADREGRAFPRRAKLAERLSCAVSSLDRAMDELAEIGAVKVQPEFREDGSRAPNSYYLWPVVPLVTGEQTPSSPVNRGLPTGDAATNESQLTRANEREEPPLSATPTGVDGPQTLLGDAPNHGNETDVRIIFGAWVASTKKTRAVLDAKRRKLITNALKMYPQADVLDAVRGWENSPHHRGENETGTVYNDLDLLLRNAGNIERFRDYARGPRRMGKATRSHLPANDQAMQDPNYWGTDDGTETDG